MMELVIAALAGGVATGFGVYLGVTMRRKMERELSPPIPDLGAVFPFPEPRGYMSWEEVMADIAKESDLPYTLEELRGSPQKRIHVLQVIRNREMRAILEGIPETVREKLSKLEDPE